jgi:predicted nucleic acid-binding protein
MIYVDTSTLLKWYIREPSSDRVAAFVELNPDLAISRLTVVEAHCALNRRGRAFRRLQADSVAAFESLRSDVDAGLFTLFPMLDDDVAAADALLQAVRGVPLRTLDALHLAIAQRREVPRLATSDRVLAKAARGVGLTVEFFGD